jgi:hypothetical protein
MEPKEDRPTACVPSNIFPPLSSIALPFPQADIRRGSKMLFLNLKKLRNSEVA